MENQFEIIKHVQGLLAKETEAREQAEEKLEDFLGDKLTTGSGHATWDSGIKSCIAVSKLPSSFQLYLLVSSPNRVTISSSLALTGGSMW